MKIAFFCQSIISDWNHGNAHFLRGVIRALLAKGHEVHVFEPRYGWSITQLIGAYGETVCERFHHTFSQITVTRYDSTDFDFEIALREAALVIVHEWNEPELVNQVLDLRERLGFIGLFHDTHHRAATSLDELSQLRLNDFDAVLAFGKSLVDLYKKSGFDGRIFNWHEAADATTFMPYEYGGPKRDLVWIGNWGDEERSSELDTFLVEPVRALGLEGSAYGVRYPDHAIKRFADAGIDYEGWLPNDLVPATFARFTFTVHIPRRIYVERLPGIPTIRVFEALACGIPLLCSPWRDTEHLFREGDFMIARNEAEMMKNMKTILDNPEDARAMAERGRETILKRHTCAHRVEELLGIYRSLCNPSHSSPG